MRQVERSVQNAIAHFLTLALPPEIPWTHIGHGGFTLPVHVAARLKRAGLKRGWPDYIIVWRGAIFLEVKRPRDLISPAGRPTRDQASLHELLRAQGSIVAVVESVAEVRDVLDVAGVPCRARVAA